jgi:hypothetical protein
VASPVGSPTVISSAVCLATVKASAIRLVGTSMREGASQL